ncbi:SDR family oxidoreductase [Desulfoluna spongiiphila]|uniref:SDR family oxidoreductase n=1 Tax=Desulfoluna spongiiphila TaxID=419481 RepID=UPI001255B11B|nr:SDR family oxidoreductase [Desulfoluna spongiiphila]VVS94719.1 short-chain dehydrogenase/reductase sdr [Desulfoluna spongiiphila]
MGKIRFDDQVVVITGAGSGIGRAYAHAFASRGARVVVNDLGGNRDGTGEARGAADTVVAELAQYGGGAVANYDSVATVSGGERIIATAEDHFGRVDVLVNNAGVLRDKSLLKMTEEDWELVVNVHLKGAFCVTRPAFALMKKNGYGRIINTTSGSGLYGNFGQAAYMAAKMGVVGLMHSVVAEGSKHNILCNAISPVAASRMTDDVMPAEILEKLKPEFITPLVLFLASQVNRETGMIFNCAAGWFSRTAICCAPGLCIGDAKREITPEEIHDNWMAITSLDDAVPLDSVVDSFRFMTSLF